MWSPKAGTGFSAELKRGMWKEKRMDVYAVKFGGVPRIV